MEFTEIPALQQKVSRIGLGTGTIGWMLLDGMEEKPLLNTILKAFDLGINLIDTAPLYGFGRAEEIVGKALKKSGKRNQIVVATKTGLNWENQKVYRDSRKERVIKEVEDSLRRLSVDFIDLYQIHWPDPLTPFSETAEAIVKLYIDGKIRAIGVSNFSIELLDAFQEIAPIHSLQSPFNLFEYEIEKRELPYCQRKNIPILGYGPLCRGLLTESRDLEALLKGDDTQKSDPKLCEPYFTKYQSCIEKLKRYADEEYHQSILALAVRWVLDKGVNIALLGCRKPEQLDFLNSVWGWKLSKQDFNEIDRIRALALPHLIPSSEAPALRLANLANG